MKTQYIVMLAVAGLLFGGMLLAEPHAAPAAAAEKKPVYPNGYNPSATDQVRALSRELLGERQIKDYHQKVHQNGVSCQLCHNGETPTTAPDDANCMRCHGTPEQMAQKTAHLERNPHKSPHYGIYASCTSCHAEHKASQVLCYDCHTFRFENFKK